MTARLLELVSVAVQFAIDLFDVPCLDNDRWDER